MHQISKRLIVFFVILLSVFLIVAQDDLNDPLTTLEVRRQAHFRPPCFGSSCIRRRRRTNRKRVFKEPSIENDPIDTSDFQL
ncbi:hypothetical protein AC249_AIPGENE9702 [Exaiptasia diaphana]|nr:hypothetical protein AC249_AIPGENE9702 [Exaiptasia diaphana]